MHRIEKEIRGIEIFFCFTLIISILMMMASSFKSIYAWVPFNFIAVYCIVRLIKKTYINFAAFNIMIVLIYIGVGSFFFL